MNDLDARAANRAVLANQSLLELAQRIDARTRLAAFAVKSGCEE
jgi:hypothetical protein